MPALFLPCSGEPPILFVTWRKIFKNYLLAIHATGKAWPEARQRAHAHLCPQYMAALRELAATCAYATMEDEILRDQLIKKAYAPAV